MRDIVERLRRPRYASLPSNPLTIEDMAEAAAEIERLRVAVAWALGEDPPGVPEFQPRGEGDPGYWWRKQLRKIARPTANLPYLPSTPKATP